MNVIDLTFNPNDGQLQIDLGGDLDNGCCGCEAQKLKKALAELGLETESVGVYCRLPVSQRIAAKVKGECTLNPLDYDSSLKRKRGEA